MVFFYNLTGVVEAVIAIAIGSIFFGEGPGTALVGIIWAGLDLGYRKLRQGYDEFPWLAPRRGGQIMFIPGWICGLILFFLGLVGWL